MTATACTEKASLISNRSTSSSAQPDLLRDASYGVDGRHEDELRRQAARGLTDDAKERREVEGGGTVLCHDDEGGCAVVHTRRVASGHRAVVP